MTEGASYLFLYMRSDAALRGRVDGENASVRTAFDIAIHPAIAPIDGLLEGFGFPSIHERGIEPVPGGVTVGEYERLFGVDGLFCKGIKLGGVPMNLNTDLRKGYRVRGICAFSVGREGDVGFVVMGIEILSVPATWERNLRPEATLAGKSGENIVTGGLDHWVET